MNKKLKQTAAKVSKPKRCTKTIDWVEVVSGQPYKKVKGGGY